MFDRHSFKFKYVIDFPIFNFSDFNILKNGSWQTKILFLIFQFVFAREKSSFLYYFSLCRI